MVVLYPPLAHPPDDAPPPDDVIKLALPPLPLPPDDLKLEGNLNKPGLLSSNHMPPTINSDVPMIQPNTAPATLPPDTQSLPVLEAGSGVGDSDGPTAVIAVSWTR